MSPKSDAVAPPAAETYPVADAVPAADTAEAEAPSGDAAGAAAPADEGTIYAPTEPEASEGTATEEKPADAAAASTSASTDAAAEEGVAKAEEAGTATATETSSTSVYVLLSVQSLLLQLLVMWLISDTFPLHGSDRLGVAHAFVSSKSSALDRSFSVSSSSSSSCSLTFSPLGITAPPKDHYRNRHRPLTRVNLVPETANAAARFDAGNYTDKRQLANPNQTTDLWEQTLQNAIGLTGYASDLIYNVALLRTFLKNHSYRIRESLYDGKPAQKTFLGILKTNRPVVKFNGDDIIAGMLLEKNNGLLKYNFSGQEILDFFKNNTEYIGENEEGELMLKEEKNDLKSLEDSDLFQRLKKLKSWAKGVKIVAFDDQFSKSELVYAVAINESTKRVSLTFRGSVGGNKDWPKNLECGQISVRELLSQIMSDFITNSDVSKVANIRLHQGFTSYLFADLSTEKDLPLYRRYYSKFDKIVSVLEAIYKNPRYADYQLVITGHSLGGALAQLMTFAVGSSEKCRNLFPSPILGITYASPSVGDKAFSDAMNKLQKDGIAYHIRISNEADLVPVGFFWYEQSGINFHAQDRQELILGGVGNTQTLFSEFRFNIIKCYEAHAVQSYTENFYGGKINRKIWSRWISDCHRAAEEGKALVDIPDKRQYEDKFNYELQEELRNRSLAVSGNKKQLIHRLREDDGYADIP